MPKKIEFEVEVWICHPSREIYVTDFPGPPAEICGYISPEARAAAKARGYATVSEIGFSVECYVGAFPEQDDGWSEALRVARQWAAELDYTVRSSSMSDYDEESKEDFAYDPEEWYGDEDWPEEEMEG